MNLDLPDTLLSVLITVWSVLLWFRALTWNWTKLTDHFNDFSSDPFEIWSIFDKHSIVCCSCLSVTWKMLQGNDWRSCEQKMEKEPGQFSSGPQCSHGGKDQRHQSQTPLMDNSLLQAAFTSLASPVKADCDRGLSQMREMKVAWGGLSFLAAVEDSGWTAPFSI